MARPSERNRQVVRQWEILTALQESPRTILELANLTSVTTRTIRRDLEALQTAAFPLYDEQHSDGCVRWHLTSRNVAPARRAA